MTFILGSSDVLSRPLPTATEQTGALSSVCITKPSLAQITEHAAWGVLEWLPMGILFLDKNLQIHYRNEAADYVLKMQDGLFEQRQRLMASMSNQTAALRKLLFQVRSGGEFSSAVNPSWWGITITRPSQRLPYEVVAAYPGYLGEYSHTVLFIFDPEREVTPLSDLLSSLYKFTHAETRVAVMLMKGKTLEEIAEEFGIKKETVRKQLKVVFEKTGTNRQSELIRLLIRGTANLQFSLYEKRNYASIGA